MKKILMSLFIIGFLLIETGCTKEYGKKDIEKYVKDNLHLTDFTVSDTFEEVNYGNDGYIDNLWYVKDNKNNVNFHVIDNYFYGMESTSNSLIDDYDNSLFVNLYDDMDKKNNIELNRTLDGGFNKVELICNYYNEDELNACYQSLKYYEDYLKNKNLALKINYLIQYAGFYPLIDKDIYTDCKISSNLNYLEDTDYDDMLVEYFTCVLSYQLSNGLNEITSEDIDKVNNDERTDNIKIIKNGITTEYDDLIFTTYGGISYGVLYQILLREGFNPEGTPEHFIVYNQSNDKYEFSYYYNDLKYKDTSVGYYYLKNAVKEEQEKPASGTLFVDEINTMFNLNISK